MSRDCPVFLLFQNRRIFQTAAFDIDRIKVGNQLPINGNNIQYNSRENDPLMISLLKDNNLAQGRYRHDSCKDLTVNYTAR